MFVSYDSEAFGHKLRDLRKRCGLSQLEVSTRTGMNCDTLRRIENGSVIPRFESLEVLSDLYKVNLLQVLDQFKVSNLLLNFYEALDHVLLKSDQDALEMLCQRFEVELPNLHLSVTAQDLDLFSDFLATLKMCYRPESDNKVVGANQLWSLLLKSHPGIQISNLSNLGFTTFEQRVLLIYAVVLAEIGHLDQSTQILAYLRKRMRPAVNTRHTEKKMYIKILINLAYNYHLNDLHEEALNAATEGIDLCINSDIMYGLYLLYYRKGIAQAFLGKDPKESIHKALSMLKVQDLEHLISHYTKVLKETYQIEV